MRQAIGVLLCCAVVAGGIRAQDPEQEEYAFQLQDAREKLLKGQISAARALFEEVLDAFAEEPEASRPSRAAVDDARLGLLDIALRYGNYEEVRDELARAPASMRDQRRAVLLEAEALRRLGDYDGAAALFEKQLAQDAGDCQVRYELGETLWRNGQRSRARELWQANADGAPPDDAVQLAFVGRSLWRLGGRQNLEAASVTLMESLRRAPDRPEAGITRGLVQFEAFGEVDSKKSGEGYLTAVLDNNGDLEEALLAMYRIRSANMVLDSAKTESYLERVFDRNPRSVAAITIRASNVLDDRRYRDAASMLDRALEIDPNDKAALCHRAAAAWLLHEEKDYRAFRERALAGDPGWPDADRILADHLAALYRFADALPFYDVARQAAPGDVQTLHGLARCEIYTGNGARAKELLEHAKSLEPGFVNPWRNNALAVQELLDEQYTIEEHGQFRVQMHRGDSEVLRAYLMPICIEAAEVLGRKYGWQPDHETKVEVLHTWDDFSVRTIGFRGFTALGACFGRLITMVSPVDGDLRKQDFMWEATAWHEYAHVLTLGLSKNRVPRWLTEGFSVYEEKVRDPSWERGMDRELFDAFHNEDIPPVRLLNRLFRGPRILFGYYQGGLIVELIARDHGFDKALDLLRAYGEDLEVEEAFERALGQLGLAFVRLMES
jgi:tetratricopeptide (TPR) repeat protein